MGRKSKEQKEEDQRQADIKQMDSLLQKYRHGPYSDTEEFMQELGYQQCRDCEAIGRDIGECNICGDSFCEECSYEHSNEETGL